MNNINTLRILACLITIAPAWTVVAKDSDKLAPVAPSTAPAAEAAKTSAPAPIASPTTPAPATTPPVDAELKAADGAVAAETKPIEPSATSKALADKLAIATSLNWNKVSAAAGTWVSGGMSDLAVTWLVHSLTIADRAVGLHALGRFSGFDLAGTQDRNSYRGVVNGFHLGGVTTLAIKEKISALVQLDIAYLLVRLHHVDKRDTLAAAEDSGIGFTAGVGGDWHFSPKVSAGPRFYAGFGRYSLVQFGGSATFRF